MRARSSLIIGSFAVISCAGAAQEPQTAPANPADSPGASEKAPTPEAASGSALSDNAAVAFRADFANLDASQLWNLFGGQNGNREVKGGPDGLWVKVASGERPWDAVGLRTSKLRVEGDFDLRGRFRDFAAGGNGSAKLIVVDAASPRGEAAYVERIQIDGKNLFKFGGEVEGSLENWGFVPTDASGGDLRLARVGDTLHAYTRADENAKWTEFAAPQPVPKTMARTLKVGVKLSSETHKSAQVRWVDLTLNGSLLRD
jgi:hypothetical protein